jgi:hypothetical protein
MNMVPKQDVDWPSGTVSLFDLESKVPMTCSSANIHKPRSSTFTLAEKKEAFNNA